MPPFDFPASPALGDTVVGPYGEIYTWDASAWTLTEAKGIHVGDDPPDDPDPGRLWWALDIAKMFIWDGDQWVITVNTAAAHAEPNEPPKFGVTDGSDAAAGEIGEYRETVVRGLTASSTWFLGPSLALSPGDWDVQAYGFVNAANNCALMQSESTTPGQDWLAASLSPFVSAQFYSAAFTADSVSLTTGIQRWSATVTRTVYLHYFLSTGSTGGVLAIRARRVR